MIDFVIEDIMRLYTFIFFILEENYYKYMLWFFNILLMICFFFGFHIYKLARLINS